MISFFLYLTAMSSDMYFAVCLCVYFEVFLYIFYSQVMKQIMSYMYFISEFGLWYFFFSVLFFCGYNDVDFAGCYLERKFISGICQFLGILLVLVICF